MKVHKYLIRCKNCNSSMMIVEMYFTQGTEIRYWVVCTKCNIDEERTDDFLEIQARIRAVEGVMLIEGNELVH